MNSKWFITNKSLMLAYFKKNELKPVLCIQLNETWIKQKGIKRTRKAY